MLQTPIPFDRTGITSTTRSDTQGDVTARQANQIFLGAGDNGSFVEVPPFKNQSCRFGHETDEQVDSLPGTSFGDSWPVGLHRQSVV